MENDAFRKATLRGSRHFLSRLVSIHKNTEQTGVDGWKRKNAKYFFSLEETEQKIHRNV